MNIISLREQYQNDTTLSEEKAILIRPFLEDGKPLMLSVERGREEASCISLRREGDRIKATNSYFVGLDWLAVNKLAIEVYPKINGEEEIDYIKMLNDIISEPENIEHLKGLVTIRFDKPSIRIRQKQDLLSIILITEYINVLKRITRNGLKKSFYIVEENLKCKLKGKILFTQTICKNIANGKLADNVCKYQTYGIDSAQNRILKKALLFCIRQINAYKNTSLDLSSLAETAKHIKPHFEGIGYDVSEKDIKCIKGNPIFKEYNVAIHLAKLLLRRYSYNITRIGNEEVCTPPFWIDMSKLFELYVFNKLRKVFNKEEITYHIKAHRQELDYLLNPQIWKNTYVIDAKYKPYYNKESGLLKEDAREVAGYARLTKIYEKLGLDEENALPIKCLIVYPDKNANEQFSFNRHEEPSFEKINGYIRMYKIGIRLPTIKTV